MAARSGYPTERGRKAAEKIDARLATKMASNILIVDHEEDLNEWLEARQFKIVVTKSNLGWRADFAAPYLVTEVPARAHSGGGPLEAVSSFVNWMFGGLLSVTGPAERVPQFTKESIERAVGDAEHTSAQKVAP